jgi:hypothetical protein
VFQELAAHLQVEVILLPHLPTSQLVLIQQREWRWPTVLVRVQPI